MTRTKPLDLMQYLPSIFHEGPVAANARREPGGRAATSDPLCAIVRLYEQEVTSSVERILSDLPQAFDPDQAQLPGPPSVDFLPMLAWWVALDPDDIAIDRKSTERQRRILQFMVGNAAALHAARGTPHGLQYLLEVCCDATVEVMEWTWPQGFQVGRSSTGIDTFLTDQPDLAHCLTVVWKDPPLSADDRDGEWLELPCRSELGERHIRSRILRAPETSTPSAFDIALNRMRHLLARECPAHVASYLALEAEAQPPRRKAMMFVVEQASTVGDVWLEVGP